MRIALLLLVPLGRRRRVVAYVALGLLLVLWLAAAATVGDGTPEHSLVGPFRWLSLSTSA